MNFGGDRSQTLGYAQFPNFSNLDGLPQVGGLPTSDGIVIGFQYFGNTGNVLAPYNLGRTTTHEIGHWLGIRHLWGDGECEVDDFCQDTPNADGEFGAQISRNCQSITHCGNRRLIENYMDYSDDGCMNLFTQCQKMRMRTVLDVSPRRKELRSSDVHLDTGIPFAFFSADKTSDCVGATINFTDLSTNDPQSWEWTFFDESDSVIAVFTSQNPQLTFDSRGIFSAQLVASNEQGSDSLLRTNFITILSGLEKPSFIEDFENPDSVLLEWVISNPDGDRTFQNSDLSSFGLGAASIVIDNFSTFDDPTGRMDALISPRIDLSKMEYPYLTFDHAYVPFGGDFADTLGLLYSVDCGQTFSSFWVRGGEELATALPSQEAFFPTSDQWRENQISLDFLKTFTDIHLALVNVSGFGNNLFLDQIKVRDVNVTALPEIMVGVQENTVCIGQLVQFEDLTANWPQSWNWVLQGATPSTSQLQHPKVVYLDAGVFDVTLTVQNDIGQVTGILEEVITVSPLPQISISADNPVLCAGEEVGITANGASNYVWFDQRSVNPVFQGDIYQVTLFESQKFTVFGADGVGCQDSSSIQIIVDQAPEVLIESSADQVCQGDEVVLMGSGTQSFLWLDSDNQLLSEEEILNFNVDSATTIFLEGSNETGCPGLTFTEIPVLENPEPQITVDGDILSTLEASSYQWFLEDAPIPETEGGTAQDFEIEESGNYRVLVTDQNGCQGLSEEVFLEVTGLNQFDISHSIDIYPNPTEGEFIVKVSNSFTGQFRVTIMNISGIRINQQESLKLSEEIEFKMDLKADKGLYFLRIQQGSFVGLKKIFIE